MAAYEVLLLNTAIPQIQAAQAGDTYVVPRDIAFSAALTLSAGTANGVPYLNASKVLTTGSALTFDGTNLGLGTASPSGASGTTFAVNGGAGQSRLALKNTNSGDASSDGFQIALLADGVNVVYQNRESGYQSWELSGSEQMRLTSTGLGIGTSSPGTKLEVAGKIRTVSDTSGRITFNNGSTEAFLGFNGAGLTVLESGSLPLAFSVSSTEKMRLTSTGTLNIVGAGTAGSTQAISFNGSTPVDTLVTTSAGYVGIKTGSPDNLLTAQADATGASFADNGVAQIIARGNTDSTKRLGLGIDTTNNIGVIQAQKFGTGTYPLAINPAGGDVGIGTSTPGAKLEVAASGSSQQLRLVSTGNSIFRTRWIDATNGFAMESNNTTETAYYPFTLTGSVLRFNTGAGSLAMTLDASGRLMIGTTTPQQQLTVSGAGTNDGSLYFNTTLQNATTAATSAPKTGISFQAFYQGTTALANFAGISGGKENTTDSNSAGVLIFSVAANAASPAERARITSGGYFKASNTGTYVGSTGAYHELRSDANETTVVVQNTSATLTQSVNGIQVNYSGASPNSTSASFLYCNDSTALRASIRSNGGLANYQSNNVDLSDARTKTDINPLGSYWSKIAGLEIVTYKYKDQTHDDLNIGVIAQQVEAVAPEFVDTDGFGDTPEDGVPLKTIYNKDLTFAAIKALQEAMARIETLEAEVAALKGA